MPWNEAARAKYEVIRERYSSDNVGLGVRIDPPAAAVAQTAWAQAHRSPRHIERLVLLDPLRLPMAAPAQ